MDRVLTDAREQELRALRFSSALTILFTAGAGTVAIVSDSETMTLEAMSGLVDVIVSVLVLAVVCTALAFVLFFALIAAIGPVRATVITYINPAVAAVVGVIVLHEIFTAGMLIGFLLVLAGSALATRRPARLESQSSV